MSRNIVDKIKLLKIFIQFKLKNPFSHLIAKTNESISVMLWIKPDKLYSKKNLKQELNWRLN